MEKNDIEKSEKREKRVYDISTLTRLLKKDFIFVIAVFLVLLIIFADISVYEAFGSVRSRKLEAQNLAVLYASEIKEKFGDERKTEISLSDELEIEDEDLIPVEDVIEFENHQGHDCKYCGCWKSYSDVNNAKDCHCKFTECSRLCEKWYEEGYSINQIITKYQALKKAS